MFLLSLYRRADDYHISSEDKRGIKSSPVPSHELTTNLLPADRQAEASEAGTFRKKGVWGMTTGHLTWRVTADDYGL